MTKLIGSAEFAGLVDAASGDRSIPPGDIEKDIWVVEVLRSIFRPIDGARVVFKVSGLIPLRQDEPTPASRHPLERRSSQDPVVAEDTDRASWMATIVTVFVAAS